MLLRLIMLMLVSNSVLGCHSNSIVYKEFAGHPVTLRSDSSGQWYRVVSSFPSDHQCNNESFASSYLCFREQTKDTVLVITPCVRYGFEKGQSAKLYSLDQSYSDKKIKVAVPKESELMQYKIVFGALKVPVE